MRRLTVTVAAAALAACLPSAAPAQAAGAGPTVTFSVDDCHELAVPTPGPLVVVTYRCTSGTVEGRRLADLVVHEVVRLQADGLVLLRSVVSDAELAARLSSLGLPVTWSAGLVYTPPPHLAAPVGDGVGAGAGTTEVSVPVSGGVLQITGHGATVEGTGVDPGGGATYRHDGPRGRVVLSYANAFGGPSKGFGGGLAHLDASQDHELASWVGASRAVGPALLTHGRWTATATLLPR